MPMPDNARAGFHRVRVIFCGSRLWTDGAPIRDMLGHWKREYGDRLLLVHGDARGADAIARDVARGMGIEDDPFLADWSGKGQGAGHIRNRLMLDQEPENVYAFKDRFNYALDRGGTENMVKIALDANVPVIVFDQGEWVPVERTTFGCRPNEAWRASLSRENYFGSGEHRSNVHVGPETTA